MQKQEMKEKLGGKKLKLKALRRKKKNIKKARKFKIKENMNKAEIWSKITLLVI